MRSSRGRLRVALLGVVVCGVIASGEAAASTTAAVTKAGVNDGTAIHMRAALGFATDTSTLRALGARTDLVLSTPVGLYLTTEEAANIAQRVRVGATIPSLAKTLQATFPASFGGIWMDQQAGGVVHVRFKTPPATASSRVASALPAGFPFVIDTGGASAAALATTFDAITAKATELRAQGYDVFQIAKDDATGYVEVTASPTAANAVGTVLAARYGTTVHVTASADRPRLVSSHKIASTYELGGLMMSGPTEGCTAGFGGITPDGHYWIVSAGHCFSVGQTIKQQVGSSGVGIIGPMHKTLFVHGGTSYCDCETIGPVTASQSVGRPTNKIYYPTNANPAIHGSQPQGYDYEGELVAMSDGNGGNSNFGQIVLTDVNNYYDNTRAWVYHQEYASYQAYPTISGDSGSPVFQYNGSNSIAEGIVSGSNSDGTKTFFSTMWQVKLYLNVSVLTYQP